MCRSRSCSQSQAGSRRPHRRLRGFSTQDGRQSRWGCVSPALPCQNSDLAAEGASRQARWWGLTASVGAVVRHGAHHGAAVGARLVPRGRGAVAVMASQAIGAVVLEHAVCMSGGHHTSVRGQAGRGGALLQQQMVADSRMISTARGMTGAACVRAYATVGKFSC